MGFFNWKRNNSGPTLLAKAETRPTPPDVEREHLPVVTTNARRQSLDMAAQNSLLLLSKASRRQSLLLDRTYQASHSLPEGLRDYDGDEASIRVSDNHASSLPIVRRAPGVTASMPRDGHGSGSSGSPLNSGQWPPPKLSTVKSLQSLQLLQLPLTDPREPAHASDLSSSPGAAERLTLQALVSPAALAGQQQQERGDGGTVPPDIRQARQVVSLNGVARAKSRRGSCVSGSDTSIPNGEVGGTAGVTNAAAAQVQGAKIRRGSDTMIPSLDRASGEGPGGGATAGGTAAGQQSGAPLAKTYSMPLDEVMEAGNGRLKCVEGYDKVSDRLTNLRKSVQGRAGGGFAMSMLQYSSSMSRTPLMPGLLPDQQDAAEPSPGTSEGRERSRHAPEAGPANAAPAEALPIKPDHAVPLEAIVDFSLASTAESKQDATQHKIHAHLGVTVKYLLLFAQHIAGTSSGPPSPDGLPVWEMTTAAVMRDFIMPKTSTHRCKFADLIPRKFVMVPSLFICHSHEGSFAGMVQCVLRFCTSNSLPPASTAVFLDIFCVNPRVLGMAPDFLTVHRYMIEACKHVVQVVDHKGIALSSLWCCYEVWLAVLADKVALAALIAASVPGIPIVHADKLQVVYDHADLEGMVEVFSSLDLTRLHERGGVDRKAMEAFVAAQSLGADSGGLCGMLPIIHAAMQQVTRADYNNASKTKNRKAAGAVRYIDAALHYANTLVLVGSPWEAEKLMRQELLWSRERDMKLHELQPMMNNLAVLLKLGGFSEEAERLCIEALDRELDPDTSLPVMDGDEALMPRLLLVNLEDILFRRGDHVRAEQLCQQLVTTGLEARKQSCVSGFGMLRPLRHLGEILMQQGSSHEAETLLQEGLTIAMADYGASSTEMAACQYCLAMCQRSVGNLTAACEMIQQCITRRALVLGDSHALTLEASVAHAGMLIAHREFDQAEKVLEQAYGVAERSLGTRHRVTLQALSHFTVLRDQFMLLGHDAREVHRDQEAESLFRRALHINTLVWSEAIEQELLKELIEVVRQQGKMVELKVLTQRLQDLSR